MTGTRTAPAVETPLAPTPKPKSAKKKDAALESDNLGSSADINAFLQMLPFNASWCARRVSDTLTYSYAQLIGPRPATRPARATEWGGWICNRCVTSGSSLPPPGIPRTPHTRNRLGSPSTLGPAHPAFVSSEHPTNFWQLRQGPGQRHPPRRLPEQQRQLEPSARRGGGRGSLGGCRRRRQLPCGRHRDVGGARGSRRCAPLAPPPSLSS